jgi:hypothetical protein
MFDMYRLGRGEEEGGAETEWSVHVRNVSFVQVAFLLCVRFLLLVLFWIAAS